MINYKNSNIKILYLGNSSWFLVDIKTKNKTRSDPNRKDKS